jgi:hypothetical protein
MAIPRRIELLTSVRQTDILPLNYGTLVPSVGLEPTTCWF